MVAIPETTLVTRRVKCVACSDPLKTYATNYCTKCIHDGELSRRGYPFFQRDPGGFPDQMQMRSTANEQSGLGDFA